MSTTPPRDTCDAIGLLLGTVTRRWTLRILWILISEGPTRFGALRRKVEGISARMLAVRLRALESEGLVYRDFTAGSPSEATYGLTAMAVEVSNVLQELHEVAKRWKAALASGAPMATVGRAPAILRKE